MIIAWPFGGRGFYYSGVRSAAVGLLAEVANFRVSCGLSYAALNFLEPLAFGYWEWAYCCWFHPILAFGHEVLVVSFRQALQGRQAKSILLKLRSVDERPGARSRARPAKFFWLKFAT